MDPTLPSVPAGTRLLGICGAPGAGKSTLAARLAETYAATVVPMDGFHLADRELTRRGLLERKGAPQTFDAEGYAALLRRVRSGEDGVLAPEFDRTIEQPVGSALPVPASGLVITEGNYLLLDEPRWVVCRALLDEVWFVRLADGVRRSRLIERHVEFGKTREQAEAWVARVDDPNAALIEASAHRADRVIELT